MRELKARKAKYGFDAGRLGIKTIIRQAYILKGLQDNFSGRYFAEESGSVDTHLKIYTDDDEVAEWLRGEVMVDRLTT